MSQWVVLDENLIMLHVFCSGDVKGEEHGHLNRIEIETEYLPTTRTEPDADFDELFRLLPWRDPIGYCFKEFSHIHIQECLAVLDELERQVRYGFAKCRYIIAIDSRVCVWGHW